MKVPAVEARVEGRSTVEDRQPRNSCCQVCYVFLAQAASGYRWNETSAGDDQRETEDDSRQQDTLMPLGRVVLLSLHYWLVLLDKLLSQ